MKFNGEEVTLRVSQYATEDRLAIALIDSENYHYGMITVNLPEEDLTNENCAFVDINNMGEEITEFIEENNLGTFTGRMGMSGFCVYPEFSFNPDILDEYRD